MLKLALKSEYGHIGYLTLSVHSNMAAMDINNIMYFRAFRRERVFRDRIDPLDNLNDEELYTKYRFSRNGILFLTDLINNDIRNISERSHAIPSHIKVLTALNFLANGCFQRVTGDSRDLGLSQQQLAVVLLKLQTQFAVM